MDAAELKYLKAGRGIIVNPHVGGFMARDKNANNEVHFSSLSNPEVTSESTLRSLLTKAGRIILNTIDDPILGDSSIVVARHESLVDDITIEFTMEDVYLLIRSALVQQMTIKNKVKKRKELQRISNELNALKTTKERKKELEEARKKLLEE